jgi:hypothetical protein
MARKKDLGGLAALAGLAYMASRDKEGKGSMPSAPTGDDQYNPDVKQRSAAALDMGEIRDEEGTLSKLRRNTETGEAYDPTGSGSSMSSASKRPAATRSVAAKAPAKAPSNPDYGNEGRRPVKEASSKTAYETPYDRMNRKNREDAQAKADTDAETRKLRSANPPSGRGVIDTSNVNPNTLLPYKKGGAVKKMASGGSVKGWGISRGARKAKVY